MNIEKIRIEKVKLLVERSNLRRESAIAEGKLFDRYVELEFESRNIDPDDLIDHDEYLDVVADVVQEIANSAIPLIELNSTKTITYEAN
jgi:hypothetical protein|tara:strand:- start:19 stop:285 length:267 start_codon:yes stop_codon:yes gene_type:complete